jgi:hypothetical protein
MNSFYKKTAIASGIEPQEEETQSLVFAGSALKLTLPLRMSIGAVRSLSIYDTSHGINKPV